MALSHAEQTLGLAEGAFPFESRFLDLDGARLHYLDEGKGPALLMVHGNPSWSYLYKGLVDALRPNFRCIALDLPGFGLSRPPPGFSFLPRDHAIYVAGLMQALDLKDVTLVGHDWGGPIGLAAARATGARVTRLFLGNTWAWRVNGDFHFEWFSKLLGGRFGRVLAERYAVFVNFVLPSSMRRRKLKPDELAAFRAPFEGRQARRAMQIFPRSITAEGAWLAELETYVASFRGPAHFLWPDKDIAFREQELQRWLKLLPQAGVTRLNNCGHFLWIEAPEEAAAALAAFVG